MIILGKMNRNESVSSTNNNNFGVLPIMKKREQQRNKKIFLKNEEINISIHIQLLWLHIRKIVLASDTIYPAAQAA